MRTVKRIASLESQVSGLLSCAFDLNQRDERQG